MKSKKYIKRKYHHKDNTMKYKNKRIRRTIKIKNKSRNKSRKMKGGAALATGAFSKMASGALPKVPDLPKVPGAPDLSKMVPKPPGPIESELIKAKGMAMNPGPLKALPMGGLSKMASSAGDSLKKMVPTSKEVSKATSGLSALSMAKKPVIIPWRFSKAILKSMRNIVTATLVLPTLSINQIVPPSLCKYYLKNDRICAQTVSEYLFKGSRPDFSKRKLTDEEKCIELNPETNKYEQCKPAKMKGGGKKNELIITCKGKIHHGLYKNDRVMVYIEVHPGQDPIVANKIGENTYIGKILSIEGKRDEKFIIELENSTEEPITVTYDEKDPNIMKYDKNFQTFLSEFEKYFYDLYKDDIKWSKKSNKNLDKFLIASLYTILGAVAIPTLIGLAAALGIGRLGTIAVGLGVAGGLGIGIGIPVLLLYMCSRIYVKIAESKTRQAIYLATMKRLIDDDKVKSEKKNLYILKQLVKINNHLRLYECPRDVLESIFEMIHDVKLLDKIQDIVKQFINNDDKEKSQEECDIDYDKLSKTVNAKLLTKFELKPDVEYVHIQNHLFNFFRPFYIDPEEENKKEACNKVNRLDPLRILDSFDKTIRGDKDNIAHIVINIFKGISSSDGDIYDNTKEILKNIQCRSGLLDIIEARIKVLKKKKEKDLEKAKLEKPEKPEKPEAKKTEEKPEEKPEKPVKS